MMHLEFCTKLQNCSKTFFQNPPSLIFTKWWWDCEGSSRLTDIWYKFMFIKLSQGRVRRRERWEQWTLLMLMLMVSLLAGARVVTCVSSQPFFISHIFLTKRRQIVKFDWHLLRIQKKSHRCLVGKTITASLDLWLFAQYLPRLTERNPFNFSLLSIRTISREFDGTGGSGAWSARKNESIRGIYEDQGWPDYDL